MSDQGDHPRPKLTLIQGGRSSKVKDYDLPADFDPQELAAYLDFTEPYEVVEETHQLFLGTPSDEPLLSLSLLSALEKYQALLASMHPSSDRPENSDKADFYAFPEDFEPNSAHGDPPVRKRVAHESSRSRPMTPGERKVRRKIRQANKLENVDAGEPPTSNSPGLPHRKTPLRLVVNNGEASL